MIWTYALLILTGLCLTVLLAHRRSRHAVTAGVGTVVAIVALLGGFSIGIYIFPVALVLLALSARHV
jgi:hypothetical protein